MYFWGAGFDGTKKQEEPGTAESLAIFTPQSGLAITCDGLLNTSCVMASIPPELVHKISVTLVVSPSRA